MTLAWALGPDTSYQRRQIHRACQATVIYFLGNLIFSFIQQT